MLYVTLSCCLKVLCKYLHPCVYVTSLEDLNADWPLRWKRFIDFQIFHLVRIEQ